MSPPVLLSRDEFREAVFRRDGHRCVACEAPGQDAHHLLERRLWPDGGYYLCNGVTVCGDCHLRAEQTLLSCEELREAAGITEVLLPPHLYPDQRYDKWGNPVLPNGTRLRGELFHDKSAQWALSLVRSLFTNRVKYPRTYHLPWSPGGTDDDRRLPDDSRFVGKDVVVTLKMDGENTTMYSDGLHARSLAYEPHPSRARVKALHARISADIPPDWRVCGENLYARHSIWYRDLPDYFLVFSVWDERNWCLPWSMTVEWAELLGLATVPVIFYGPYDRKGVEAAFEPHRGAHEGYVVRTADGFHYADFRNRVAKYVRKDHVQTHGHWMRQRLVPNELAPR